MNNKYEVLQTLTDAKIVAVIRGKHAEEAIQLSKAAAEGGIQAIEVTYTTPNAADIFRALEQTDVLLGAGSVLDPETARQAMLAGARFIVSPHFNQDIAILCNRYSVPYLPGCMTISDMVKALEAGCDVLKLFPASHFEPSFIRSIKGPLPNVNVMPTGGVNLDNVTEWLEAGAVAVGIASDLNKAYQKGGYQAVVNHSQSYVEKCAK
ncbi:2-dehydro-3-deoxyphosphogluconate aldolase/(4S)-4-hydroxy-2-oxoglutarate aldolase [Scopulibacillus darangshiensis]|uniref:2-dehydro-3-deoxyphosphogluconate aldolase/(4S)-4-hydroxy-2-oxoglutarate aldolase n=1 Tax=Scopulibacillus darangshiensis TaxID=442528 RepID=A0A4R2NJ86_9BACL|nr:bifunctional 2-keto-4-hydroxyglutarate aldolase/2-keto-3-deoxy-6-phosphogluconate aldolase [Scopulibacillus darangshiensis]TCP21285.1 2-dehydro-3-deoxyphosphogluconate aldolase/(4S)-4-hydroxy-2-oxoglutarate aldolase [Scopulibacillus darangshiensis]